MQPGNMDDPSPIFTSKVSDSDESEQQSASDEDFGSDDSDSGVFDFFSGAPKGSGEYEDRNEVEDLADKKDQYTWKWVPLSDVNDIRIITILEAESSNNPLRCTFKTTSLDGSSEYFALSYCWGETYDNGSHLTHVIYCDDLPFKITANLHAALVRIRNLAFQKTGDDSFSISAIWIDAICIDQNNAVERSRQVMLMHRIYEKGKHLFLWAGELEQPAPSLSELQGPVSITNRSTLTPLDSHDVEQITLLRQRPLFKRRWIVQEALLCQRRQSLLFGPYSVDVDNIAQVLVDTSAPLSFFGVWGAPSTPETASLLLNLSRFNDFQCSDDRDRIYSLLSVSTDGKTVIVDYNKATDELYHELAMSWIRMGYLVPVLIAAVERHNDRRVQTRSSPSSHGLPYWVPDWRLPRWEGVMYHPHDGDAQERERGASHYATARLDKSSGSGPMSEFIGTSIRPKPFSTLRFRVWLLKLCAGSPDDAPPRLHARSCPWCFFFGRSKHWLSQVKYGVPRPHENMGTFAIPENCCCIFRLLPVWEDNGNAHDFHRIVNIYETIGVSSVKDGMWKNDCWDCEMEGLEKIEVCIV